VSDEAPFGEFFEATPDAVLVIDRTGQIRFANSRVEPLLGYLPQDLVGLHHDVLLPKRYRGIHATHVQRFLSAPATRMMGRGLELVASRKDGSEFKTEISLSPYQGPDGLVVIVAMRDRGGLHPSKNILESENAALRDLLSQAGIDAGRLRSRAGADASQHEAAQRLQGILVEELHHRLKNLLTMVIGITSQTLRAAQNLDEGRDAVMSRLAAMGRAQDLLLADRDTGAELADVVRAAIEPFDNRKLQRFSIANVPIELGPEAILPLTLSLNELCTNAVKYGALSNKNGHVSIKSQIDEETQLFTLSWTEAGGPIVQVPTRRGFGTRLLGALATQLHGDVRVRYEPTGISYQLDIPLALIRAPRVG
jgi:PAS domain S-box-containing protein